MISLVESKYGISDPSVGIPAKPSTTNGPEASSVPASLTRVTTEFPIQLENNVYNNDSIKEEIKGGS